MNTYSHSRISTFEQCKLKYNYSYIEKVETDIVRTIETFMGDLVHQTLEKLYKDLKFEKYNELQDLLDFYNNLWEEKWEEGILIVKEEYSADNYRAMGERMIKDYYNHYKPFNQAKTIGLETTDYYDLDEEHRIHVRIDRLASPEEGVYEIHDYKTNSHMKTQEEADKDRQLAVYALGVKKQFPDAKRVKLIWHMLAFDKEVVSERTDEELEKLKLDVLESIKKIEETTEYEPTKSALCDYCEYKSICPLFKHLYKTKELSEEEYSEEDGVKLVENYAKLKEFEKKVDEKLDSVSEKIKKYAEQHNCKVLFGKDNSVMIWSKDTTKFPGKNDLHRKEFKEALKELGLYEKYLEIDNWNFEKEYPNLSKEEKKALEKYGKKQKIFRLYLKKK